MLQRLFLNWLSGMIGKRLDGYKVKIGIVLMGIYGIVALVGKLFPDQNIPGSDMEWDAIFSIIQPFAELCGIGGASIAGVGVVHKAYKAGVTVPPPGHVIIPISDLASEKIETMKDIPKPCVPDGAFTKNIGGYVRISVMLLLLVFTFIFAGCSTTNSLKTEGYATKSLLSMQKVIVTSAVIGDKLCTSGVITNKADCKTLKSLYEQAGPAYDLAADSLVVALNISNAKGAWDKFQEANKKFTLLYVDMLNLAVKLGYLNQVEKGGL